MAPIPGIVVRSFEAWLCRIKIGRALANVAPRLKQGQYDPCKVVMPSQKLSHIAIKHPTRSFRDDKTERLHQAADLVANLVEMLRS